MVGAKGDERGLQWLTLSDFRSGIVSQSYALGGTEASPVPALNMGSAQEVGTWGCIGLPGGGLAPLPSQDTTAPGGDFGLTGTLWFTGLLAIGPVGPTVLGLSSESYLSGADELVFSYATYDGTNLQASLHNYQAYSGDSALIYADAGFATTTAELGVAYSSLAATTILTSSGSFIAGLPRPGIAFNVQNLGHQGVQGVYPDPTNPTVVGYYQLANLITYDIVLCHNNRIVALGQPTAAWPPGPPVSFNGADEYFNYTDPPGDVNTTSLSIAYGQYETFVAEFPYAHGAWGSVSNGELFLVRFQGGAYIINGDFNANTSVTRLFGVQPTYGLVQIAAQTTLGIVYGSTNRGVWAWGGGSNSTKISPQLNDDFFMPQPPTYETVPIPTLGPQCSFVQWGDWIITPNNWLLDTVSGGWWRLSQSPAEGGAVPLMTFYAVGWNAQYLWAVPTQSAVATDEPFTIAYAWDRTTQATGYSWTSYPMAPAGMPVNWKVEVQEIVVTLQCNADAASGTITVTLTDVNGDAVVSEDFRVVASSQPQTLRQHVRAQFDQVVVNVTASGSTDLPPPHPSAAPAPMMYSLSLGYKASPAPVSPG